MLARRYLLPAVLLSAMNPGTAKALVIAGPTGLANSTQASLNSWISGSGSPSFAYWDNVITVSDASGVYMGAVGTYGWVLTAAHVTNPTPTITVQGTPFTVRDNIQIGSSDLRLYRIGGGAGDPALPSLSNIPISSGSPSIGTAVLNFGRGERQETTSNSAFNSDIANTPGSNAAAFEWAGAGTMRWGTNVTESTLGLDGATAPFITAPGLFGTTSFVTRFNDPGAGNYLTTTETALAGGDSGGPAFVVNGGLWEVAGINSFVTGTSGLSAFGNASGYVDLATYRSSLIAAMVPEPSAGAVAGLALAGLAARRRRRPSPNPSGCGSLRK